VVYNIKEEATTKPEAFAFKELTKSTNELRWIYFDLSNFDDTPDVTTTIDSQYRRYYRTNFWEAKPDPENSGAFFLSHRGFSDAQKTGSPHSNSILRVSYQASKMLEGGIYTDKFMTFERVYGFKGELEASGKDYPGSFDIANVQGKQVLVVDHFRDLYNWPRNQTYFAVAGKIIGENDGWVSKIESTDPLYSYNEVALTSSGRALATSFYGDRVILLDVIPETDITTNIKTIQ
jgi:hypothetical protein